MNSIENNETEEFQDDELFENYLDKVTINETDPIYLKCLKENFGHNKFREKQWQVISSLMFERRDNCVVMATGYGKSLCFQFTSVYLDTVTIVVSPLISLMEDQVLSLTVSNVKSCFLGSAQTDKSILDDVFQFKYNLIYVTPEYITGSFGENFLLKLSPKLSLIAIDEAHCISKWGHDFRSAFRNLSFIRKCVPHIPILAMTATATKDVQNDICNLLNLNNPQIVCTGVDRPNLEFNVKPKSSLGIWKDIGDLIKSVEKGSIIVYCLTRKNTEELCEILQRNGIICKVYHAGLTLKERKKVHEDFVRDKLQVIIATIAFGMGIDKPDIRMVIHYGASKDIESYYQEVGRAGRDGLFSRCFMFYSNQDWKTHDFLISRSMGTTDFKDYRQSLMLKMREYCNLSSCRREFIIKYFEGSNSFCINKVKNCCDNCKSNLSTVKLSEVYEELENDGSCDFTKEVINFLSVLDVLDGWKGITTIIHFLRGSKRQTLGERWFNNEFFGIGKNRSEEYYKMLADLLEINGYISKRPLSEKNPRIAFSQNKHLKFIHVLTITEKGKKWFEREPKEKILFKPAKSMYKYMKLKNISKATTLNNTISEPKLKLLNLNAKEPEKDSFQNLVTNLLRVRSSLASTLDVMPYMILSNKAVHQLAQKCPLNLEEFKEAKLDGVSDIKIAKFAPAFIKCILQFKNFAPPDENELNENKVKNMSDWLEENPLPDSKALSASMLQTFEIFKSGKSVQEISQIKHLAESTVSNYIAELIKHGLIYERKQLYRLGISDSNFEKITDIYKYFNNSKIQLKPIKEKCPPTISYDMIKYVLNYHRIREHLTEKNIEFIDPDNLNKINKSVLKTENEYCYKNIESFSKLNETTNENDDLNWESDDNVDFSQIDCNITQENVSISSQATGEIFKSELIETHFNIDENEELNWAIENLQNKNSVSTSTDGNNTTSIKSENERIMNPIQKNTEIKNIPVKRKINVKRKAFVYEDSISDSSDDEKIHSKINR